jgi:hypothetical protein
MKPDCWEFDQDTPRGALQYAICVEINTELKDLVTNDDGTPSDEDLAKSVRQCIDSFTRRVEDLEAAITRRKPA